MTFDQIKPHLDAYNEIRGRLDYPLIICNVMQTQMSIARFYGGINAYGKRYRYLAESDILVERRFFEWVKKRDKAVEKAELKSEKDKSMNAQQYLELGD